MKFNGSSVWACASVVSLSLALGACGGGNAESMLTSAKEYLAKSDDKAAVIQIKNALQKNPDSAEARYLLGIALLNTGDVVASELEFRKALQLKYSADDVVPKLAAAMLAQGQSKKLIDEFAKSELTSSHAKADFQTVLASAYSVVGNAEQSQAALAAALVAEPGYTPALIGQARQKATNKDFDGALAAIDAIIVKSPASVDAWKLKGDVLYYGKNQQKNALEAYRKVAEIKPDNLAGHTSILAILLSQGDMEGATSQLEQLKKIAPNNSQTKYLEAQLAYQKRDFKTAREASQQLLRVAPNNPKGLQLAGAVEFQLKSYVQAEAMLNRAVTASPELVLARRLLIMTYLRLGQPAKALTTLNQGLSKGYNDPEIDSVAGEVYLQNGDAKKAEEHFAKAAKLDPQNAKKQTSLALVHLMGGKSEAAFGELQDIATSDSGVTADLALISANLRRGDFDKALKAIDGLEKKQPDKPLAANLRGRTLLAKKDLAGARKSFERALALDPAFFPAVASLAGLDLVDKKPEEAKKRFEAVLAKDPKNGQALLAMAELAARTGAPKDDVAKLINKAVEANPTEVGPRLLLIDFYLGTMDQKQAMNAAQSAVSTVPDNADLLDALGRVQLAAGEANQALATFNKVVALQPLSTKPLLRLADANLVAKNKDGAAQALRKALDVNPDLIEAQRGLIMLNLEAKKYSEAVATARSVQKQRPKEAVGYVLEGDVAVVQKNWESAVGAYRAGLKETPSPELAVKLHSALLAGNKTPDAEKFAVGWLKDHGTDVSFPLYLGDLAIVRKDYVGAEKNYASVVKIQPNNAVAYNNLAWVTGRLNKPGAIEFAETAVKLAPNQPAFMDTLAMLFSDKDDYAKALEWQTKAVTAQPQNTVFKLNLAKIYIKGGKKDLARKELDDLAKLGDKFGGQAEVTALIKTL